MARQPGPSLQSVETRASWRVAVVSLVILGISWGGPWVSAVGLKQIAADLGGTRSAPALASRARARLRRARSANARGLSPPTGRWSRWAPMLPRPRVREPRRSVMIAKDVLA
jgi:hypothetical protein